jgi:hypothetical protein
VAAGVVDQLDLLLVAGAFQRGLGLLVVPDIGQGDPAGLAAHQQPGFDQVRLAQVQPIGQRAGLGRIGLAQQQRAAGRCALGLRVIKGLAQDRADRKVERVLIAVACGLAGRHPHRSQLVRVVAEQRCVQVIRQDAAAQ